MADIGEQLPEAQLEGEEAQAAAQKTEERRVRALDEIGMSLERQKEDAVKWRAEFEIEWSQDYDQYNTSARSTSAAKTSTGASTEPAYRQTADNITRPKVIITAARLGDMLFPTNEANWAVEATPKPEVPEDKLPPPPAGPPDEQGNPTPAQPYTADELVQVKRDFAAKAARNMGIEIKDQLEESSYAEQGRAAIFDGCLYGSGVMRGPVLKTRRRHTFKGGGYNAEMVQQAKPHAEYVDLWSFFPQPSRSMKG